MHVGLLIWVFRSPRPLQPPNSPRGQIWPQIWNQCPQLPSYTCACYPFIPRFYISEAIAAFKWPLRSNMTSDLKSVTSITLISMCILLFNSQFLYLRGHCGLQTALEVKSDLGFEISDPKNPCDQSFRVHLLVTLGTCQQEREKSTCSWPALALQVKIHVSETKDKARPISILWNSPSLCHFSRWKIVPHYGRAGVRVCSPTFDGDDDDDRIMKKKMGFPIVIPPSFLLILFRQRIEDGLVGGLATLHSLELGTPT